MSDKYIRAEVHEGGDLLRVVVTEAGTGRHLADFEWDPTEPQTPENRRNFRRWVEEWIKSGRLDRP